MITSDYTNSLDPNVVAGTTAYFDNELPSESTLGTIDNETNVTNTTVYAGYNPNDDSNAPELGAVAAPIGECWTPLIVFVVFYIVRIVYKKKNSLWASGKAMVK